MQDKNKKIIIAFVIAALLASALYFSFVVFKNNGGEFFNRFERMETKKEKIADERAKNESNLFNDAGDMIVEPVSELPSGNFSMDIVDNEEVRKSAEILASPKGEEAAMARVQQDGVLFVSYSSETSASNPIGFGWQAVTAEDSQQKLPVEKTFICWSMNSLKNPAVKNYANCSPEQQGVVSEHFSFAPQLKKGAYYFRAYAKINGREYWSDEIKIAVTQ